MTQAHERRTSDQEEDTAVDETQARTVGNEALHQVAQETDKKIDLIDDLLNDPEFSEESAQEQVNSFVQKNGQ